MENIKLYVYVVLKHILDLGQKSPIDQFNVDNDNDDDEDDDDIGRFDDDDDDDDLTDLEQTKSVAHQLRKSFFLFESNNNKKEKERQGNKLSSSKISKLDLLDLDGPKLIIGSRSWLLFYQIIGQLNWHGKPLYLSFLYKSLVATVVLFNVGNRFIIKMYHLNIVNENYRNPIFLFISFLTMITLFLQGLLSFRANLLDLCPFFKILSTPKLCFVREEVQHIVGTRWLKFMLIFFVYNAVVMSMLVSKDLNDFIYEFKLINFLIDLFTLTVMIVSMTGMSFLDLYIRTCFGHWLLALKNHIESRFTYLHKHQRRLMKLRSQLLSCQSPAANSEPPLAGSDGLNLPANNMNEQVGINGDATPIINQSMEVLSISATITTFNTTYNRPLLTFDEIQKHLNKMDDHLEATRSVQIGSLVLLSLNAFLLNGALFLLSYHLLADQHNFYHGFLVLLLAINCIFVMFLCYSGDRWVFYALSSFTQTVEDEYFMQSDIRPITSTIPGSNLSQQHLQQQRQQQQQQQQQHLLNPGDGDQTSIEQLEMESNYQSNSNNNNNSHNNNHHMLLIKKKDVLFCHEFLHQFENHLATPWSNLTVKTHLHMLRTFVTLIAAQIIFDHEH